MPEAAEVAKSNARPPEGSHFSHRMPGSIPRRPIATVTIYQPNQAQRRGSWHVAAPAQLTIHFHSADELRTMHRDPARRQGAFAAGGDLEEFLTAPQILSRRP